MNILESLETRDLKTNLPVMNAGNTVKVHVRIVEGKKERIQVFEGVVIGITGKGLRSTFTVRKVSNGVGVERMFPIHSPIIEKIDVVQRGKVRQGKLYYMRKLSGKAARIKEISREKRDKIDKRQKASQ